MTPTEQDKELREKIHSALFADDFPILNDIEKDAVDRILALIRTEKLKLLAEVRERVVGSLEPQSENGLLPDRVDRRNQLRTEQRTELTKLEAEL